MNRDLYRESGVNIDAGNEAAKRYSTLAGRTARSEVAHGIGGFSGGFKLNLVKYPNPLLVSGTDGVGTKLRVAFAANRHDTIGIDCVAMCVNDILTSGAEPLFFLDYLAVNQLDVDVAEAVVGGVAAGCEQAGCALIGGETAEMGDVYSAGEYDLAGTVVGVVNEDECVNGSAIVAGDAVIGLSSTGLHSNGYSLVRKLLADAGVTFEDTLPGIDGTVADELLKPTAIYVRPVHAVLQAGVEIRGMAHITGGGLLENIPRCLPNGVSVELDVNTWTKPAIFDWLQEQAGMSMQEAARVWNVGIGYTIIVPPQDVAKALEVLEASGQKASVIGQVVEGDGQVVLRGV